MGDFAWKTLAQQLLGWRAENTVAVMCAYQSLMPRRSGALAAKVFGVGNHPNILFTIAVDKSSVNSLTK